MWEVKCCLQSLSNVRRLLPADFSKHLLLSFLRTVAGTKQTVHNKNAPEGQLKLPGLGERAEMRPTSWQDSDSARFLSYHMPMHLQAGQSTRWMFV